MISFKYILQRLKTSSLFKDSFWSVFGNGLGNVLLLLAGILIARLLGKDIYGEYGVVKTTMFHIAAFATLGLGFTSTRFVAKYRSENIALLKGSIKSSLIISLCMSSLLCFFLFLFSESLAHFLNESSLSTPFRFLGIIIICRSISVTSGAILAGYKSFKTVGINTIASGLSMLVLSSLLTYFWGLIGSLSALLFSQALLCLLNLVSIRNKILADYRDTNPEDNIKDVLKFTFPVALQELSYTLSHLGVTLILTKYASFGEVGLYTAAAQWNAIILFVPYLLSNVVLAHLSGESSDKKQFRVVKIMLLVNLIAALVPFLLIFFFSGLIVSFYGETFVAMQSVMNILVFSTIFDCMCRVFQSNLISEGKNWVLLLFRTIRDTSLLFFTFLTLVYGASQEAASRVALVNLLVCMGYFVLMSIEYLFSHKRVFLNVNVSCQVL